MRYLIITFFLFSYSALYADSVSRVFNKTKDSLSSSVLVFDSSQISPQIVIQNNIPESGTDYFSAIIPILTLILGFILNKWYERWTNNKKTKEIGTQWAEHFIQLQEPLKQQFEKLTKYILLNDENHFEITDPYFNIRLNCNEFSSLDEKGLIHYLNNGKNKLDYKQSIILAGQLKDIIKLIEHNSSSYKEQIKIMTNEVSSHISLINPILNEFKIQVAKYWDYANTEYTDEDPRMVEAKKMNNLMREHILPNLDSGEFDLFKLSDAFIKPFFASTFVDREHPRIENINSLLNSIDMHIKAIRMEKKYFRINLEKILEHYKEQLFSVSEMILKPVISNN
jgi:hypothetical protein